MMVKLYNKNFTKGDIEDIKSGDVIVYPSGHGHDSYLIVKNIEDGEIYGTIASIAGVNAVPVKDIVSACNL